MNKSMAQSFQLFSHSFVGFIGFIVFVGFSCGPEEIRTLNLLDAIEARCHCATGPGSKSTNPTCLASTNKRESRRARLDSAKRANNQIHSYDVYYSKFMLIVEEFLEQK